MKTTLVWTSLSKNKHCAHPQVPVMSGKSFLEVVEVVLGGLVIICLLWKRMVVETTPRQATSEEKFDQKKKKMAEQQAEFILNKSTEIH